MDWREQVEVLRVVGVVLVVVCADASAIRAAAAEMLWRRCIVENGCLMEEGGCLADLYSMLKSVGQGGLMSGRDWPQAGSSMTYISYLTVDEEEGGEVRRLTILTRVE